MKKRATKKRGNRRAATVSAEAFVKAWGKGGTIVDVAGRVGMDIRNATSRGARFRKAGVKLPALDRRGGRMVDVDALNALLKGR